MLTVFGDIGRACAGGIMGLVWLSFSLTSSWAQPTLKVPEWTGPIQIDGWLNEPCYQQRPLVNQFVIAGQPKQMPQLTRAWVFWQTNQLVFAFECQDTNLIAAPPSLAEHDVDAQDRIEIFLWSGRAKDDYLCIEIGARGAMHDYRAKFYRQFNDSWYAQDAPYAISRTRNGFIVEGAIPASVLQPFGFQLRAGTRWRVGLFRADFHTPEAEPQWITWFDARGPKPDFHVARSFGKLILTPAPATPKRDSLTRPSSSKSKP
jgi:hypothetical protein